MVPLEPSQKCSISVGFPLLVQVASPSTGVQLLVQHTVQIGLLLQDSGLTALNKAVGI